MAAWGMERASGRSSGSSARPDGGARAALERELRRDVDALTRHGDRASGGAGHAAARDHVARRLGEIGLPTYAGTGYLAPFGAGRVNVLAAIHGADRHRRPVVLATNYDGVRGSPGASENAASVALVLAAAPLLQAARLERGVVVALLDGVAPPRHRDAATGASVLLSEQLRHDVKAAVVLDRLGNPGDDPRRAADVVPAVLVTGAETDARMPDVIADATGNACACVPVHRRDREDVAVSAPLVAARVPYLELHGGHWSGHGTPRDTPDRLDLPRLAGLVALVAALVRRLDAVRLPGPFEGYDSSAFEAEARRRARSEGRLGQ
jgi:hypothetical protein